MSEHLPCPPKSTLSHFSVLAFGSWLRFPAHTNAVFIPASSHGWAMTSWFVPYFQLLFFRPRNKRSKENDTEGLLSTLVALHVPWTEQATWLKQLKGGMGCFILLLSGLSRPISQQQEPRAAAHGASTVGKWRVMDPGVLPHFTCLLSAQPRSTQGGPLYLSLPGPEAPSQTSLEACFHGDHKSHQIETNRNI